MSFYFVRSVCRILAGRDDMGEKLRLENRATKGARDGAERYTRGNVAIQGGSFLTIDDQERERRTMARHQFKAR
ncbi:MULTISPECIES: hypothetical protein [unclassified Mesorhizobium]|uniref:hypothetical protein n=1 Tax=unclassified Mesorhizobium TaxID=325217 RepID=UPI00333DA597